MQLRSLDPDLLDCLLDLQLQLFLLDDGLLLLVLYLRPQLARLHLHLHAGKVVVTDREVALRKNAALYWLRLSQVQSPS